MSQTVGATTKIVEIEPRLSSYHGNTAWVCCDSTTHSQWCLRQVAGSNSGNNA